MAIGILSLGCVIPSLKFTRQDQQPLTLKEYNKKIARDDKMVLVYFHASWCMVCEKIKPVVQEVESENAAKLEVLSVDTDKDKEVASEFEIDALPVLMLYKKGSRQWINLGIIDKKKLQEKIDPYLN
jgi:thioredoxin 1